MVTVKLVLSESKGKYIVCLCLILQLLVILANASPSGIGLGLQLQVVRNGECPMCSVNRSTMESDTPLYTLIYAGSSKNTSITSKDYKRTKWSGVVCCCSAR